MKCFCFTFHLRVRERENLHLIGDRKNFNKIDTNQQIKQLRQNRQPFIQPSTHLSIMQRVYQLQRQCTGALNFIVLSNIKFDIDYFSIIINQKQHFPLNVRRQRRRRRRCMVPIFHHALHMLCIYTYLTVILECFGAYLSSLSTFTVFRSPVGGDGKQAQYTCTHTHPSI